MRSVFLALGALCAFVGVGMGAFGAHALKASLSPESLAVYQTGVTYQMWHSLGLITIALVQQSIPDSKRIAIAGWLMFLGILLFSGSLYLLVLLDMPKLGMITPIGGVCFLIAWLLLCLSASTKKTKKRYK
ncbi:DUF423 domain-containing protein [Methyloglobulus sp.]|uniref:DUF423 domain-containing protein n=1 Tax=Methyloglobulus sp. TaxID=2518622 RepID=UPI0032B7EA69